MSEENGDVEEFPKKKIEVTVKKEGNEPDYKELYEDAKAKLEMIAEKELSRREEALRKQGWRGDIDRSDPELIKEQLKEAEKEIRSRKAGGVTPLSQDDIGRSATSGFSSSQTGRIRDRTYDSMEEMFADLEAEAKEGNKEAEEYLKALFQKGIRQSVQQGHEFEFEGSIKEFAGKDVNKQAKPEDREEWEEKQKREKSKWKRTK